VLSIGDDCQETNAGISDFVSKIKDIVFLMVVNEPPLMFDSKKIGTKVNFNSLKYDSMDGFIKNNEECMIMLPSVYKQIRSPSGQTQFGDLVVKANVLPLSYEFP